MDFEQLRAERQALNNAVLPHGKSIEQFGATGLPWFRLTLEEVVESSDGVRHLSTSASCIESLSDVPAHQPAHRSVADTLQRVTESFANGALTRPAAQWESEGAAEIYCRVRTLPIILDRALEGTLTRFAAELHAHVVFVWDRLIPSDLDLHGISELVKQRSSSTASSNDGGRQQHYPPNAFHTRWALRLLSSYEARRAGAALKALPDEIRVKRAVARLWCNRTMSAQAALIKAGADRVDAHQLAWALVADYEERQTDAVATADQPAPAATDRRDLYAAALAAFFGEQTDAGGWPLYEPLFHYPQAGNAYCYTFETLAELLRPALQRRDGRVLRQLLRPYLDHLVLARGYAERTGIDLADGGRGWTSGHHPHRQQPESVGHGRRVFLPSRLKTTRGVLELGRRQARARCAQPAVRRRNRRRGGSTNPR